MPKINRRQFILGSVVAIEAVNRGFQASAQESHQSHIQTVLGPMPVEQFGPALIHEHVMCDFIGARETGPHRWVVEEVVKTMLYQS
jgi:hypothetical protein